MCDEGQNASGAPLVFFARHVEVAYAVLSVSFSRLFAAGLRVGRPQLVYVIAALTQLLAAALVLSLPRSEWEGQTAAQEGGGEQSTSAVSSAEP